MNRLEAVPDPQAFRIKYLEEAEEARSNPGQWFRLLTKDSNNAAWSASQQVKNGRRAAFRPAGSFDSVARDCDVLICYIGGHQ